MYVIYRAKNDDRLPRLFSILQHHSAFISRFTISLRLHCVVYNYLALLMERLTWASSKQSSFELYFVNVTSLINSRWWQFKFSLIKLFLSIAILLSMFKKKRKTRDFRVRVLLISLAWKEKHWELSMSLYTWCKKRGYEWHYKQKKKEANI